MYSLDKRVAKFVYTTADFHVKNASREVLTFVLNYLIDYLNIT